MEEEKHGATLSPSAIQAGESSRGVRSQERTAIDNRQPIIINIGEQQQQQEQRQQPQQQQEQRQHSENPVNLRREQPLHEGQQYLFTYCQMRHPSIHGADFFDVHQDGCTFLLSRRFMLEVNSLLDRVRHTLLRLSQGLPVISPQASKRVTLVHRIEASFYFIFYLENTFPTFIIPIVRISNYSGCPPPRTDATRDTLRDYPPQSFFIDPVADNIKVVL